MLLCGRGLPWVAAITVGIVAPIAVITVVVAYGRRNRAREIAARRAWATRHGFDYFPEDARVVGLSLRPPFGDGKHHRGQDAFWGFYRGRHLVAAEYQYYKGSGENSSWPRFQVVGVSLPRSRPYLEFGRTELADMEWAPAELRGGIGFRVVRFEEEWLLAVRRGPLKTSEVFPHAEFLHELAAWVYPSSRPLPSSAAEPF
jgi:hypothetical protein